MKIFFVVIAGCALILGMTYFVVREPVVYPTGEEFIPGKPLETENIRVLSPLPGAKIKSPLVVRGEARGTWYFEASFPVRLKDANGKEIAVKPAQADGEWMTTGFVPFEVTLTFDASAISAVGPSGIKSGTLILEKDNPSAFPEHADSVSLPIIF
ncbi:MAG: Gmad2 immunoglobulin-like domain-containing protein [Patescibacteria group bacterium]